MGKTLDPKEKVLYSNGDAKNGSELVKVGVVTTTVTSDKSAKPVKCIRYKTLADALKELGAIERQKGTKKFVKDVIDRGELLKGRLVINHNAITGGGSKFDPKIEDSEFTDPRLPYFIDVEYVEVGYALSKQWIAPGFMYGLWTLLGKPMARLVGQEPQKNIIDEYNYRPNRLGIQLGRLIANQFEDIMDFAEKLAANECATKEDPTIDMINHQIG